MNKSFADLLRRHWAFIIPFLILILIASIFQLTNTKIELFFWTNIHQNKFFDEFFKKSTMIGDKFTITIIVTGFLFVKYRYSLLLFLAYGYTTVIVQILKRIFDSPRPIKVFEELNPIRTIEDYPLNEWHSFPSGHAATAFTLAVVLSYLLPGKKRHWILVLIAAIAAFSRVYLSQHFFQDVLVGSVLAVILTFQMIWHLENSHWFHSSRLDGSLLRKA